MRGCWQAAPRASCCARKACSYRGSISITFSYAVRAPSKVEQQAKAFDQLRTVLILALVLVYAVMASQYESLKDPFIIMFTVPFGLIGVFWALFLTKTALSVTAARLCSSCR